jgi:streptomycin 6-kinase
MVGDPAFDPWPLLTQVAEPFREESPTGVLRARSRVVCAAAGLDPSRVAAWAMARSVESALWRAAELGDRTHSLEELSEARTWSRLAV